MTEHAFDQAVALAATTPDHFTGHIPQTYGNMVGPFGGAIAATLLNAVLLHPDRLGDPVSMTVNYAGPIADAPFTIQARAARTNRSTQHWLLELVQEGQVATTATVFTARRQPTWSDGERQPPSVPSSDALSSVVPIGFPGWTARYDFRFVRGELTLDGREQADSETVLWVRDEPPRPLDFLSLMALSDVFFPRVFLRRQTPMPAGTVSITTHFHADADSLARQGGRHVLAVARGQRFHNGYFDQTSELWGDDGMLLASSSQVVYFKG